MKTFDELNALLHKEGVTIIEHDDLEIPAIILKNDKFDDLMRNCNRHCIVDSRLDIWHDDNGHVFVNIILEFQGYKNIEVLLYANDCLKFFEVLAESSIISIIPEHYETNTNIFMIQLAKRDKMEEAFNSIKAYMKLGDASSYAC